MNYLGPKILANFKDPPNPNKERKPRSKDKRPGMDPQHVKNVAKLPSIISGKEPCDAHHLKIKKERGCGLKATDQWCVPLTRTEHMELEKLGSRREEAWFKARGVDPYVVARGLWTNKGSLEAMRRIVMANLPEGTT